MRAGVALFLVMLACACATTQDLQPRTARETLAVAEITLTGAIETATRLHAAGVISSEYARTEVLPVFEQVDGYLNAARILIAVGDEQSAGDNLTRAIALLQIVSLELSRRDEAARSNSP